MDDKLMIRNELKLFSKEELIQRAKKSNEDYASGKFISQEDLEIQSENW